MIMIVYANTLKYGFTTWQHWMQTAREHWSFPATNVILSENIWLRICLTGALSSILFRMFLGIAHKAFSAFLVLFSTVVLFASLEQLVKVQFYVFIFTYATAVWPNLDPRRRSRRHSSGTISRTQIVRDMESLLSPLSGTAPKGFLSRCSCSAQP